MATVTQVVKRTVQPAGGYISPKQFELIEYHLKDTPEEDLEDTNELIDLSVETTHPTVTGVVVDYLTRAMIDIARTGSASCTSKSKSLNIINHGAHLKNEMDKFEEEARKIKDLSDESINAMCRLTAYDTYYRSGMEVDPSTIYADPTTCEHIRLMVQRTLNILSTRDDGMIEFEPTFNGGYSEIVSKGDGDYVSPSTLYDLKVSKNKSIDSKQTLQLAIYLILARRAVLGIGIWYPTPFMHDRCSEYFADVENIAIINPRYNIVYELKINEETEDVLNQIEQNVVEGKGPAQSVISPNIQPDPKKPKRKVSNKSLLDF